MKTKTFLLTMIVLLMMVGGAGCEKENERNNVPYAECDCVEKEILRPNHSIKGALFFKATTQIESKLLEQLRMGSSEKWVIYNIQTKQATLYIVDGTFFSTGRICNFPDFAKEWNISNNGQKIYIEGIEFKTCKDYGGIGMYSYFDYVLTTLVKE